MKETLLGIFLIINVCLNVNALNVDTLRAHSAKLARRVSIMIKDRVRVRLQRRAQTRVFWTLIKTYEGDTFFECVLSQWLMRGIQMLLLLMCLL